MERVLRSFKALHYWAITQSTDLPKITVFVGSLGQRCCSTLLKGQCATKLLTTQWFKKGCTCLVQQYRSANKSPICTWCKQRLGYRVLYQVAEEAEITTNALCTEKMASTKRWLLFPDLYNAVLKRHWNEMVHFNASITANLRTLSLPHIPVF